MPPLYFAIVGTAILLAACAPITEHTGLTAGEQLCLALHEPDPDLTPAQNARAAARACLVVEEDAPPAE